MDDRLLSDLREAIARMRGMAEKAQASGAELGALFKDGKDRPPGDFTES